MPRHKTSGTAQRTRQGAFKRKARQGSVRKRQRRAAPAPTPAPFAASLSSLRLVPKGGLEVALAQGNRLRDPAKMLRDLTASYRAAEQAWGNPGEGPADLGDHGDVDKAIIRLTKQFKERFCGDLDFIVADRSQYAENTSYFTLFKICEQIDGWKVLEARNFLYTCTQISRACIELGHSFLRLLDEKAKVCTWYDGSADDPMEYLCERLAENVDESIPKDEWDDDDLDAWRDIQSYRIGEAAWAAKRIREAKLLSPDELIARLARVRKPHRLIDQMVLMCELLRQPYQLYDFDNPECDEYVDEDQGYISLSEQHSILWNYKDHLGQTVQEYLDAQWNSGASAVSPCAIFEVKPDREDWSLEALRNSVSWPKRFADLLRSIDNACVERPKDNTRSRLRCPIVQVRTTRANTLLEILDPE